VYESEAGEGAGGPAGGGLPEGVNWKDVFPLHEFLQDCFQFIECFRPAHFFFLFL
jgi:hypothetical protein